MQIKDLLDNTDHLTLGGLTERKLFSDKLYEDFIKEQLDINILLEYRVDFLKTNVLPKLQPVADKLNVSLDELFDLIQIEDSSKKKTYMQWIMNQLIKNSSDISELKGLGEVLSKFDELKNKKKIDKPDISGYTFKELRDTVAKVLASQEQEINKEEQKARNESQIISENSTYLVVVPKTEFAAGYFGRNSLWCTAAGYGRQADRRNNMFGRYSNNKHDIYTIYNKKDPSDIYQIHVPSVQFMDSENSYVSPTVALNVIEKFPKLLNLIAFKYKDSTDLTRFGEKYGLTALLDEEAKIALEKFWNEFKSEDIKTAKDALALLRGRVPEEHKLDLEKIVATDVVSSYEYAHEVLNGRFELGEQIIATDAEYSYRYAHYVVKGGFELGEQAISTSAYDSYKYAYIVLKGRFELGEPTLAADPDPDLKWAYLRKFPDAIDTGLFSLNDIDNDYEDDILTFAIASTKRNKPLSDDIKEVIDDSPYLSYAYAIFGIGGRYPDGEAAIQRVPELYRDYKSQMEIDK